MADETLTHGSQKPRKWRDLGDGSYAPSVYNEAPAAPVTADTELPAAIALSDAQPNPTAPSVGSHGLLWNGAAWVRAPGNTDGAFTQGNVASGATDSGNPVKVGGVNRTTRPTYADGQRAEAHYDTRGAQFVTLSQANSVSTVAVANSSVDDASQNTGGLQTNARVQLFDGTTFDRWRGDATGGGWVQGNVSSGVADAGNPLKLGAVYRATRPTVADGQRVDAQADTRGSLRVILAQPDSGANFAGLIPADDQINNATGLVTLTRPQWYDGATWDMGRGDAANGLDVDVTRLPAGPTTATVTRLTMAGAAQTAAASNANRKYLTIVAEDAELYIKWGSSASATDYTVKLTAGQTYELPLGGSGIYSGIVTIFAATGDVQVTEA